MTAEARNRAFFGWIRAVQSPPLLIFYFTNVRRGYSTRGILSRADLDTRHRLRQAQLLAGKLQRWQMDTFTSTGLKPFLSRRITRKSRCSGSVSPSEARLVQISSNWASVRDL
jgi:hypothetical protein